MREPTLTLKTTFAIAILAVISFSPVQAAHSVAKAATEKHLKIYSRIGKAFAESMINMETKK